MNADQIFIYVTAVIIVGFIFIFGFRAIGVFSESADMIQEASFVKELEREINAISLNTGNVRTQTVSLPRGYGQVCFINLEQTDGSCLANSGPPQICNYWIDVWTHGVDPLNVFFLRTDGTVGHAIYVEPVRVSGPNFFICKSNRDVLTFEGERRTTLVT